MSSKLLSKNFYKFFDFSTIYLSFIPFWLEGLRVVKSFLFDGFFARYRMHCQLPLGSFLYVVSVLSLKVSKG